MEFIKNTQLDIEQVIEDWLNASNSFDTEKYLDMYYKDAILNDPSVGRKFRGIRESNIIWKVIL